MARLSRRLWGGTSLKTAAKEANGPPLWSNNSDTKPMSRYFYRPGAHVRSIFRLPFLLKDKDNFGLVTL